jgi:hypothetical protein
MAIGCTQYQQASQGGGEEWADQSGCFMVLSLYTVGGWQKKYL